VRKERSSEVKSEVKVGLRTGYLRSNFCKARTLALLELA
jgi:hypothetical protein